MAGVKTLIRLYKFKADEERRVVAELEIERANILQRIENQETEIAQETQAAHTAETGGFAFPSFLRAAKNRLGVLNEELRAKEDEIAAQMERVRMAFQDLKKAETAQQNIDEREAEEEAVRVQEELDEIAQNQHLRR